MFVICLKKGFFSETEYGMGIFGKTGTTFASLIGDDALVNDGADHLQGSVNDVVPSVHYDGGALQLGDWVEFKTMLTVELENGFRVNGSTENGFALYLLDIRTTAGNSMLEFMSTDDLANMEDLPSAFVYDKELDMLFERLYEDNVAGKIDDARFARMSKRYEQEQGEIGAKVKSLRLELKKAEGQQMDMEDFLETVRRYTHVTKITRRMVGELIDHIDVYHAEKRDGVTNQRVVIHYNCIGAFDVPDRRKIPEADIIMETRKGVAVSYAPAQIAV